MLIYLISKYTEINCFLLRSPTLSHVYVLYCVCTILYFTVYVLYCVFTIQYFTVYVLYYNVYWLYCTVYIIYCTVLCMYCNYVKYCLPVATQCNVYYVMKLQHKAQQSIDLINSNVHLHMTKHFLISWLNQTVA